MARSCNWSHNSGCAANGLSADATRMCAECKCELLCDLCVVSHGRMTSTSLRMHAPPPEIRDQITKRARTLSYKGAAALESASQSESARRNRNPPSATTQLCTWQYSICQKAAPATHLCAECIEPPGSGYLCEECLKLHKQMDLTCQHADPSLLVSGVTPIRRRTRARVAASARTRGRRAGAHSAMPARTGGGRATVQSAVAAPCASTGSRSCSAKSVVAVASAYTGGSSTRAKSAMAAASASTRG
jgi:hypothetical protein